MGIDPMNNISIIIRILFAVTLFQQGSKEMKKTLDRLSTAEIYLI
jgi:hypothetical protein